jgi:hypothetical protein
MRRRAWHLMAALAATGLVAASCSSPSPSASESTTTAATTATTAANPATAPKKSSGKKSRKTIYGTYSNGESITGNSGTGVGPTGTVATVVTTTTVGVAPGATPPYVVTKTGRVRHRRTAPVISKFHPVASPAGGTVTIVGKRLQHATAVSFDGIAATISSNSPSRIRAVVPTGATSGSISVVTPNGSSTVAGFVVS